MVTLSRQYYRVPSSVSSSSLFYLLFTLYVCSSSRLCGVPCVDIFHYMLAAANILLTKGKGSNAYICKYTGTDLFLNYLEK